MRRTLASNLLFFDIQRISLDKISTDFEQFISSLCFNYL